MENGMAGCVGVSNQTDFIRSTTDGVLVGSATPIHRGRTQQLWQVTVTREGDGKLVARGQVRLQNVNSTEFGG
jgi:acyl-coenzyme A thioesterase PaaI-like protein